MNVYTDEVPDTLSIEIPGKQRAREQADSLAKRAARHGFYPSEGVNVLVHDTLAKVGSEVQLTMNGKVIATHAVKFGEPGTAIKFSVQAEHLPQGVHVLGYQVKQNGAGLWQGIHQAALRVKTMPLSHLGFEVSAGDDRNYASIDVGLESCVSVQQTADEVFRFVGGLEPALFSPDGKFMYVTTPSDFKKIDLETRKIVRSYEPAGMRLDGFSSDGGHLYVTSWFSDHLSIVDLVGNEDPEQGAYIGEGSAGLVPSHDAKKLFVATRNDTTNESFLVFIDTETQEIVDTVAVGLLALSIVLNPFRDEVYVGCLGVLGKKEGVFAVNTNTGEVKHIPAVDPWKMALSPNGQELYVFGGYHVTVIDTLNNGIKKSLELYVTSLTVSADGKLVYCYNLEDRFVSVYDAQSWSLIREVEMPIMTVHALSTQKDNGEIWVMLQG